MTESSAADETSQAASEDDSPQFRVVFGNPTESELAAVTAVLTAMADELGNGQSSAEAPVRSAWSHSQRPVRSEIRPGPGAWNRKIV